MVCNLAGIQMYVSVRRFDEILRGTKRHSGQHGPRSYMVDRGCRIAMTQRLLVHLFRARGPRLAYRTARCASSAPFIDLRFSSAHSAAPHNVSIRAAQRKSSICPIVSLSSSHAHLRKSIDVRSQCRAAHGVSSRPDGFSKHW